MDFLLNYIRRLTYLLIIYTISRIYFYVNNIDRFEKASILEFVEGCRFDISVLIYINIPLFFLLMIPTNMRTKNICKKFTNFIFYSFNIPFIILNNVDIEYFKFTQKRSTTDLLQILQLGEDAKSIIPQYMKDHWELCLFTIIQIWFVLKIKTIPKTTIKLNYQSIAKNIFILIIGSGFAAIFVRGGLQLKPIKSINAGELSNSENTALILNTPFCILHSLKERELKRYKYFKREIGSNNYSPIHIPKNKVMNKQNVIILIMESYSKQFVGFYNNKIGYTPFLDSLMDHSLVFTNAYANGLKSIEALPAITASIPSLMDIPFITSNYSQNNFEGIATILKNEGYHTSFYHGGKRGTMGFYSFSKKSGFIDYFGLEEYNNLDDSDGVWGIYDGPFMQYFADGINNTKEPFFSTFFSLSSHKPYNLPDNYLKKINKKRLKIELGIEESILYSDNCLRNFFDEVKTKDWFKNTIFIITADHTSAVNYDKKNKQKARRYAIPLAIYHGNNSVKGTMTNIVQHIDIMPTILKLLNYNKPFFSFGKSMFSNKNWAINFLQNEYLLITDKYLIVNKEEKYTPKYYNFNMLNDTLITDDINLLKSIKQSFNNGMITNKISYEN